MIFLLTILNFLIPATILSSPVSVPNGGTGVSSLTAYAILISGTTTIAPMQQVSGTGSATQLLTANGTGVVPSWQNDANASNTNGCVFITTATASNSASLSFNSTNLSSTYKIFMIILNNLQPSSSSVTLYAYWSTDNGSTLLTTGYSAGVSYLNSVSGGFTNTNSTTFIPLGQSTSNYYSGILYFYGANGALTSGPMLTGITASNYAISYGNVSAFISGNPNINYIQFQFSSGNISSGSISLYGLT